MTWVKRYLTRVQPQVNGAFSMVQFIDELSYPGDLPDLDKSKADNVLFYFIQRVTAPARLAGNVMVAHETIDQVKEPRMAWLYNAGQRHVRRAPQVAYDGPATAADGLATSDNYDMFNGTAEALYDLLSGRYSVMGLKNEEKQSVEFGAKATASTYTSAALRQAGVR